MTARRWLGTTAALVALAATGLVVGGSPAIAAGTATAVGAGTAAQPAAAQLPIRTRASGGTTFTLSAKRQAADGRALANFVCNVNVGTPFQTGTDVNVALTVSCNIPVPFMEMYAGIYKNFQLRAQNYYSVGFSNVLYGNAAAPCEGRSTNNYQGAASVHVVWPPLTVPPESSAIFLGPRVDILCV